MDSIIYVILFLIFLASIIWIRSYKFDHWERIGIPYVPGSFPLGSQSLSFNKALHEIEVERYKKYGRLYGFYEGVKPMLSIADPDLLRNIFVKDFQFFTTRRHFNQGDKLLRNFVSVVSGEQWKRLRTIITPAFTTGKIKKMTSIILSSAETLTGNFDHLIKSNEPLDVKRYFGAFTMDVIACTAFATKVDSHNDPDNKFVTAARSIFGTSFPWRLIVALFFPALAKITRLATFPPKATSFLENSTLEIIKERRRTGQKPNDFLQLLLDASADGVSSAKNEDLDIPKEEQTPSVKLSSNQKGLSHDEVIAQCVIFFLAAFETTASTLAFVCYELALNQEYQKRLIAEVDSAISNHQGELTYEAAQEMKYVESIIHESLRKYPPVLRIERTADEDYVLGDTGVTIAKGTIIGAPAYAMHHDPEFYPEPSKFNPERFSPEAKADRHPYTYLPFGQGPRNCLGMRFAMMEMKLCLAHVFRSYRLKINDKTKIPLEFHVSQNLLQPKEILLTIEKRPAHEVK